MRYDDETTTPAMHERAARVHAFLAGMLIAIAGTAVGIGIAASTAFGTIWWGL